MRSGGFTSESLQFWVTGLFVIPNLDCSSCRKPLHRHAASSS
ncbi:MAG: hypothetical protein E2602_10900 [Achromobacter sp.]|nr:hypothetical protein [Achromobacter sp.]